MGVKVLFLGPLRDVYGAGEVVLSAPLTWTSLLDHVPPGMKDTLTGSRIHVAHQGTVLADKTALDAQDGSEVALLPPVSGG